MKFWECTKPGLQSLVLQTKWSPNLWVVLFRKSIFAAGTKSQMRLDHPGSSRVVPKCHPQNVTPPHSPCPHPEDLVSAKTQPPGSWEKWGKTNTTNHHFFPNTHFSLTGVLLLLFVYFLALGMTPRTGNTLVSSRPLNYFLGSLFLPFPSLFLFETGPGWPWIHLVADIGFYHALDPLASVSLGLGLTLSCLLNWWCVFTMWIS